MSAPPAGYRSALQLARLILTGASFDPTPGWGGDAFTISLARIWENAVSKMCRELSTQTGWHVAARSESNRRWDDAIGPDDPTRSMIADTLLRRGNQRWILDAKYKRSFGNESRNDRFQMCDSATIRTAELTYVENDPLWISLVFDGAEVTMKANLSGKNTIGAIDFIHRESTVTAPAMTVTNGGEKCPGTEKSSTVFSGPSRSSQETYIRDPKSVYPSTFDFQRTSLKLFTMIKWNPRRSMAHFFAQKINKPCPTSIRHWETQQCNQ